jgi:hypothetical protein
MFTISKERIFAKFGDHIVDLDDINHVCPMRDADRGQAIRILSGLST